MGEPRHPGPRPSAFSYPFAAAGRAREATREAIDRLQAMVRVHRPSLASDAITERLYLYSPVGVAFVLVGLLLLAEPLLDGGQDGGVAGVLFLLALAVGLGGLGRGRASPARLRPAWQRRQVEGIAARKARAQGSGPFALDVVKLREPVRDRQRFTTEEAAAAAACVILSDDPEVEHVIVVDSRVRSGVRYVDR
jgi:hypothetical protein